MLHDEERCRAPYQNTKESTNTNTNMSFRSPPCLPKPVFGAEAFMHKKPRSTPSSTAPHTPVKLPSNPNTPRTRAVSRVFGRRQASTTPGPHSVEPTVSPSDQSTFVQSPHYDKTQPGSYLEQAFVILCKLGEGSFGEVYKVRCKADGRLYAIKRSSKRLTSTIDRRRQIEEANYIKSLGRHPHCVSYYGAWEEGGHIHIQIELCERGTLQHYLDSHPQLPEAQIWSFVTDLALGLSHIHGHNLVHLDIKPDNVFLTEDGTLKIGDFGIAMDLSKGKNQDLIEGDPKYMSPELLKNQFDRPADIFSLGIMTLEMCDNLDLPNNGQMWSQLRSGWIPQLSQSSSLRNLIREMMHPDPRRRPSANGILKWPEIHQIILERAQYNKRHINGRKIRTQLRVVGCFMIALWYSLFAALISIWRCVIGVFGTSRPSVLSQSDAADGVELDEYIRASLRSPAHSSRRRSVSTMTINGSNVPGSSRRSSKRRPPPHPRTIPRFNRPSDPNPKPSPDPSTTVILPRTTSTTRQFTSPYQRDDTINTRVSLFDGKDATKPHSETPMAPACSMHSDSSCLASPISPSPSPEHNNTSSTYVSSMKSESNPPTHIEHVATSPILSSGPRNLLQIFDEDDP